MVVRGNLVAGPCCMSASVTSKKFGGAGLVDISEKERDMF
jgi:hypothetical protein